MSQYNYSYLSFGRDTQRYTTENTPEKTPKIYTRENMVYLLMFLRNLDFNIQKS